MRSVDTDRLLSAIVEDGAGSEPWDELESRARAEPELWRSLAETYRDQVALTELTARAEAVADGRDAPPPPTIIGRRLAGAWAGWAVAAAVVVAWAGGFLSGGVDPDTNQAGVLLPAGARAVRTTDEAREAYLYFGRQAETVIGEMPDMVLVESQALSGDSGFEVVFIRRFVERVRVPDLYEYNRRAGSTPEGESSLIRFQAPDPGRM